MQEPWYVVKIALVSIWFEMVLTQTITQVYKGSHLTYPQNINILTSTPIVIPTGRFFDTIIDVDY